MRSCIAIIDDKRNRFFREVVCAELFASDKETVVVEEPGIPRWADILARRKIQKCTGGILNRLLFFQFGLGKFLQDNAEKYDRIIVLFGNYDLANIRYPARILNAYKKRWKNLKLVLFYLDPADRKLATYPAYLSKKQVFDLTYTFDKDDARKNEWIHWLTPYSASESFLEASKRKPEKDIYFCGSEVDRKETLRNVFVAGYQHQVDSDFNLVLVEDLAVQWQDQKELKTVKCFESNVRIPYEDVVRASLECSCNLEIKKDGQSGLTLRPYEAVLYNRKLLTNFPAILDFPYYDPKYMQYFERVEDIDWDWIKEKVPVDYHYRGDFSPIRLIEDIERRLGCSGDHTESRN